MSNLQRFNSQLENMLDDLIRIFPDAKSIRVYKEKFILAKSANPQIVLLVFLKLATMVQDTNNIIGVKNKSTY